MLTAIGSHWYGVHIIWYIHSIICYRAILALLDSERDLRTSTRGGDLQFSLNVWSVDGVPTCAPIYSYYRSSRSISPPRHIATLRSLLILWSYGQDTGILVLGRTAVMPKCCQSPLRLAVYVRVRRQLRVDLIPTQGIPVRVTTYLSYLVFVSYVRVRGRMETDVFNQKH